MPFVVEFGKVVGVLQSKGEWNDGGDVCFGTVNVNAQPGLVGTFSHHLQPLLVVGTGPTDPDFDPVGLEDVVVCLDGLDKALEGSRHVGEVGDTATDDEDFASGVHPRVLRHQADEGFGILVGVFGTGCTGVFSVIGQFGSKAKVGNRVGVDDGGSSTSDLK